MVASLVVVPHVLYWTQTKAYGCGLLPVRAGGMQLGADGFLNAWIKGDWVQMGGNGYRLVAMGED